MVEAALRRSARIATAAADRACASPISAPARARCCWRCSRELPAARGVGTDLSPAALACARANAAALGLADAPRSSPAIRARRSRAASISWLRIRPMWRAATSPGLQPEVRVFDPHAGARRRPRRPCRPIARSPATRGGCWRRDGILVLELGAGQMRRRRGACCAAAGLRRPGRAGSTSPACRARSPSRSRHSVFATIAELRHVPHISGTQKSTWIVGQDRLGFAAGIDPRRRRARARSDASESHRREDAKP